MSITVIEVGRCNDCLFCSYHNESERPICWAPTVGVIIGDKRGRSLNEFYPYEAPKIPPDWCPLRKTEYAIRLSPAGKE